MSRPIRFLKPFAAWATALTDRYRFDPQVRTTVQIVFLQVGLTLLSILVFGWALQYVQEDTVGSIAEHIRRVVGGEPTSSLPQAIDEARQRSYTIVFIALALLNVLFGYLIAQFALRPTRQTLAFQKRFIGNVAHEIRTPLAVIKTATEVALFEPDLPRPVRKTFEDTIIELDRISDTINNLLSFDSLLQPKVMQFSPVDLTSITETVVERHRELAASRNITLTLRTIEHAIVTGNATALDQVVTNLLKNALKYTPAHKNGMVEVELGRTDAGGVFVSVSDTGIGIAQKDLYHVFEPFYRADTSRTRGASSGTSGLGLAIVHEIVRLHKGTITVRSAVHHGTTVRVSFPPAKEGLETVPLLAPSGSPHEATLDFSRKP